MRTRTCVLLAALAHTHTHTLPDISRPKRMRSEFHLIVTFFAHKPGNKWLLACSAYHARRLQFRKANGMDVFHFVIFVHDNSSHLFIFGFRHFHRFARIRFPCFPMAVCDVQRDSTNEICMRVKWRIFSHFARRNMLRHADCELLLNHLIEIKSESKRNGYCCFNQKQFRLFHFLELCVCNAISAIWQMPMNNYIFFLFFLFVVVCCVECVCVHSLEFICQSIRYLWAMETSQSTSNNYVICLSFSLPLVCVYISSAVVSDLTRENCVFQMSYSNLSLLPLSSPSSSSSCLN